MVVNAIMWKWDACQRMVVNIHISLLRADDVQLGTGDNPGMHVSDNQTSKQRKGAPSGKGNSFHETGCPMFNVGMGVHAFGDNGVMSTATFLEGQMDPSEQDV